MGYLHVPSDYARELKRSGKRAKARAFFEYYDDMDSDEINAISFYAKGWSVSKSTVHAWIKDFKVEIDRYHSFWILKNSAHYNSVKNQTERQPNDNRTIEGFETPMSTDLQKSNRTIEERQPNEVFNINNNTFKKLDKNFEDMYLRCRYSNKYTGNKESAYLEYQSHSHITHSDMAYAYMIHSNDPQTNGKTYNLTNFMKNQAYLNYLNPQIVINKDDTKIVGYYDQSKGTVITDDNVQYTITKEKFATMVASGEIVITSKMKVA